MNKETNKNVRLKNCHAELVHAWPLCCIVAPPNNCAICGAKLCVFVPFYAFMRHKLSWTTCVASASSFSSTPSADLKEMCVRIPNEQPFTVLGISFCLVSTVFSSCTFWLICFFRILALFNLVPSFCCHMVACNLLSLAFFFVGTSSHQRKQKVLKVKALLFDPFPS